MDLDERAKPAVLAYKRVVHQFPPSTIVAALLGLFRRSPTIMLCILHIFGYLRGWYSFSSVIFGLLLPFVYMEIVRIHLWILSCREYSKHRNAVNPLTSKNVDPMTLLLMDENFISTQQLPRLLIVWQNVYASVEVVELSLTVTRCVQTTTVANDAMANLLILVKFGYEILQHGWIHGITTIGKELMHLHVTGTDPSTLWHGASSPDGASYTSAAISLVRNGDIILRNINVLSEDERDNIGKVIAPIIGFLALIVGQGWLWGRQIDSPTNYPSHGNTKSTVEIVELTDDHDTADSNQNGDTGKETEKLELCDDVNSFKLNEAVTENEQIKQSVPELPIFAFDCTREYDPIDINKTCEQSKEQIDIKSIGTTDTSNTWSHDHKSSTGSDSKLDVNVKDDPNKGNMSAVSIDDIAEMMDLLSQCDEYGLLDANTKSAILVKLSKFHHDGNDSFGEWYGMMRTNLRNLLDSREILHNNLRSLLASAEMTESSKTAIGIKSDPDEAISTIVSPIPSSRDANPALESLRNDSMDHLELGSDSRHGALSVSSEEDEKVILTTTSSEINVSDTLQSSLRWPINAVTVDDEDSDDEYQPLQNTSPVLHPLDIQPTFSNDESMEKCMKEQDEENIWLKIGSGVAILGGIVGGVVMMNAATNRNHGREKKR